MQRLPFFLLFSLGLLPWLHADFPSAPGSFPLDSPPNDPGYGQQWQLFSYIPARQQNQVTPLEKKQGSGMAVDIAWQYHLGQPETTIAILDSGVIWQRKDILGNEFLNRHELPLPENSVNYDTNQDGRFSILDYQGDSRVQDFNKNGVIDPGDLISAFSDHIDDDANGFIDDIAGWDFQDQDNNPFDQLELGHGSAGANYAAGQINNQIGKAGICGNCSIIFLRTSDSFIVETNRFSAALLYALAMKVDVVQAAVGAINANPMLQKIVSQAYDSNMLIVGSAADEYSFHHNFPAIYDPILYTNAIRFDTQDPQKATTFTNFNNCSNYGARVDVATSALHCSSEATANLSGIAALASSYARYKDLNLHPGELIALIKNTATDIDKSQAPQNPFTHPTWPNWDTRTGYGRVNAGEILKKLAKNAIPPSVKIDSPKWFELFRRSQTANIDVHINVPTPRHPPFQLQLEVRKGVESEDFPWHLVLEKKALTHAQLGKYVSIPVSLLEMLSAGSHDDERNRYAFTIRLIARDASSQRSETRRTFFLFDDPWLLPAFPLKLSGSGESSGFFADLNHDTKEEFITADGAGYIHAFQANGKELPGFPANTMQSQVIKRSDTQPPVFASIYAAAAGGYLNQDGQLKIITISTEGHLQVIQNNGMPLAGFPLKMQFCDVQAAAKNIPIGTGVIAAPVISDLDNNGTQEIVIAGLDGCIHVYNFDGKPRVGFPVRIAVAGQLAKLVSSPAIFDLNGDGIKDIVLGSNHQGNNAGYVFALDGRGRLAASESISGFPVKIPIVHDQLFPTVGTGIPTNPVIGDVDGDGIKEIVIHPFIGKAYLLNFNGTFKRSLTIKWDQVALPYQDNYMLVGFGHPTLADINGDGLLNPVIPGGGNGILVNLLLGGKRYDYNHLIGAWNGQTGKMLPEFPATTNDLQLGNAAIHVDLDGSGKESIISSSGGYWVNGYGPKTRRNGFPHFTGGWVFGSLSAGDMDGDGNFDIAATTREGYVFVWKTSAPITNHNGWYTYKGNKERTGIR